MLSMMLAWYGSFLEKMIYYNLEERESRGIEQGIKRAKRRHHAALWPVFLYVILSYSVSVYGKGCTDKI